MLEKEILSWRGKTNMKALESLGLLLLREADESATRTFKSMRKWKPKNKRRLKEELWYFWYFVIDLVLHSLQSEAEHDERALENSVYDALRDAFGAAMLAKHPNAEEIAESGKAYGEAVENSMAPGGNPLAVAMTFTRRSGADDVAIGSLAAVSLSSYLRYEKSTIQGVVQYLIKTGWR